MQDELIERKAKEFCLDPLLVRAVIQVESNFNPWATRYEANFLKRYINPLTNEFILSRNPQMRAAGVPSQSTERRELATSWGLMQIMGETARAFGFRGQYLAELCDLETNLHYGCTYLANKRMNYQTVEQAVSAYNAGMATDRNKAYVDKVMRCYGQYQKEYAGKVR